MKDIVILLLDLSVQTSLIVCAVLLFRWFFSIARVPKKFAYAMWIIPFFRMLCPWSIQSPLGLMPVQSGSFIGYLSGVFQKSTGIGGMDSVAGNMFSPMAGALISFDTAGIDRSTEAASESLTGGSQNIQGTADVLSKAGESALSAKMSEVFQSPWNIAALIWLLGIVLLVSYSLFSFWRLKKKLACSMSVKDQLYILADYIDTPFVLGIVHPKIYLPSGISHEQLRYALAHELVHIKRKDHIIKLLAFVITCIYWFNPFSWLAFRMMGTDMEMSCDEAVLEQLGTEQRSAYALVLLELTAGKKNFIPVPLAFGEGDTKGRVVNIMKYRKPLMLVGIIAVVSMVLLACGLLTQSENQEKSQGVQNSVENEELILLSEVEDISVFSTPEQIYSIYLYKDGEINTVFRNRLDEFQEFFNQLKVRKEPVGTDHIFANDESMEYQDGMIQLVMRCEEEDNDYHMLFISSDYSQIWVGTYGESIYQVAEPEKLSDFIEEQIRFLQMERSKEEVVSIQIPQVSAETSLGADGMILDFADPHSSHIIMHGYMGLFVYEQYSGFVRAVDLKSIGCADTQGDNYCEVSVSPDGYMVYLHPVAEDYMYEYDVLTDRMVRKPFDEADKISVVSTGVFADPQILSDYKGDRAYSNCILGDRSDYHYLYWDSWNLKDLYYHDGDSGSDSQDIQLFTEFENGTVKLGGNGDYLDSGRYAMTINEGTLTASGAKVTIYNHSQQEIMYGEYFHLKKLEQDEWVDVPYIIDNWGFNDIGYVISGEGSSVWKVQWDWIYGELPAGTYLLSKNISTLQESGESAEIELSVQFVLK